MNHVPTMDLQKAFAALGLDAGASSDDVRRSYRELAKVWHPDRFQQDPALLKRASHTFRSINEAYRQLTIHFAEQSQVRRAPNPLPPDVVAPAVPHTPPPSTPDGTPPRRSMRGVWIGAASVLLVMIVLAMVGASRENTRRPSARRYATITDLMESGSYASSRAELTRKMDGVWSNANGAFEFRSGVWFAEGGIPVYGYYESLTARSILFRTPDADDTIVVEVTFADKAMYWHIGTPRRLMFVFYRK